MPDFMWWVIAGLGCVAGLVILTAAVSFAIIGWNFVKSMDSWF